MWKMTEVAVKSMASVWQIRRVRNSTPLTLLRPTISLNSCMPEMNRNSSFQTWNSVNLHKICFASGTHWYGSCFAHFSTLSQLRDQQAELRPSPGWLHDSKQKAWVAVLFSIPDACRCFCHREGRWWQSSTSKRKSVLLAKCAATYYTRNVVHMQ